MNLPFMDSDGLYRIQDEPRPGKMAHLATRPLWPLLSVMLGGIWISWPWFVLNSLSVGSPTRRQEWAWLAIGFAGLIGLWSFLNLPIVDQVMAQIISDPQHRAEYLLILFPVWKLLISFKVYFLQSRSMDVYLYYGGPVRNGALLLVIGFVVSILVLPMFASYPALYLMR